MHIHSVYIAKTHMRVHAHTKGQTDARLLVFFFFLLHTTSAPTPTNTPCNNATDALLQDEKENILPLKL